MAEPERREERSSLDTIFDGASSAASPSLPTGVALAMGVAAALGIGGYIAYKRLIHRTRPTTKADASDLSSDSIT